MVEDNGDDGGSESSDLVAKRGERRKTNTEDERKRIRVTLPGSVHLWTQSRRRGLDRCKNQVRWVSAGFFTSEGSRERGRLTKRHCVDNNSYSKANAHRRLLILVACIRPYLHIPFICRDKILLILIANMYLFHQLP